MQVQPVVQSVSTHVIGLDATLDEVKAIAHGVISQDHMRLGIDLLPDQFKMNDNKTQYLCPP